MNVGPAAAIQAAGSSLEFTLYFRMAERQELTMLPIAMPWFDIHPASGALVGPPTPQP
jgi:hypothetical protein